MAKQTSDKQDALAARIAGRELAGWTVDPAPARGGDMVADGGERTQPDDVVPPLDQLKRHFLGDNAAYRAGADAAPADQPGATVVTVRSGEQRKVVGVNTKSGEVEWRQG